MILRIAHNRSKFSEKRKVKAVTTVKIVELTIDQQNTVDNAFKSEYLKDEISLSKLFDEYDFDLLDNEDN